ncbi:Protoporphyrin uptake protein 1 [Fusarium oxysporum f. sp. albedinis]|nr:Protoporphyrin uptake protein 1 [Fusarium oxysporum f. sp. albedinis]
MYVFFTSASISVNTSVGRTLSSISSAQMAHSIEPPLMKPDFRRVEISLCVWQLKDCLNSGHGQMKGAGTPFV